MIDRNAMHTLARQAADWLTKRLFLAAYEAADDAYWQRRAHTYSWRSLGGVLAYAPDLQIVPDGDGVPVFLLTLKAASNAEVMRVKVKVKAKKAGRIHEQVITVDDLCSIPVRKPLTEIPLRSKHAAGDGGRPLGDIYIKLQQAVTAEGVDLLNGKRVAEIFTPTGMEVSPERYRLRWGQCWNVDEFNRVRQDLIAAYYRRIVKSAGQLGRPLWWRRAAFRWVTTPVGLALAFWAQNLFTAKAIRGAIARHAGQHKAHGEPRADADQPNHSAAATTG